LFTVPTCCLLCCIQIRFFLCLAYILLVSYPLVSEPVRHLKHMKASVALAITSSQKQHYITGLLCGPVRNFSYSVVQWKCTILLHVMYKLPAVGTIYSPLYSKLHVQQNK
jgi:hypothetical protein